MCRWALPVLTVALLALRAWGFSSGRTNWRQALTSGEERLVSSQVLNLVMFGLSLIAALGTAFLAGPTIAGEIESGTRSPFWRGRSAARRCWSESGLASSPSAPASWPWPGSPSSSSSVSPSTTGRRTPSRAWRCSPGRRRCCSRWGCCCRRRSRRWRRESSPSASSAPPGSPAWSVGSATPSGMRASPGSALSPHAAADGWPLARCHARTPGPDAVAQFGGPAVEGGFPFLSKSPLTATYLAWTGLWVALLLGLAAVTFLRRDL